MQLPAGITRHPESGTSLVALDRRSEWREPCLVARCILWSNKKYLCFRFVSDKNIGFFYFFSLTFIFLSIVVYKIEVEIVYL